ncbi:thymidylate kinase, partial [gut metagenome]
MPVKVDREERPDIDSVYIEVCTALTGGAGWPLTIIMSPDQQPFFAATYMPKENLGNQMGLKSLLLSIADMWQTEQGKLLKTAGEVTQFLLRDESIKGIRPNEEFLHKAVEQLYASYDSEYGGFGSAPKFPTPHNLIFLLRYSKLTGDKKAREITEHALRQMYRGGIFDHIGGGFCRYSTDREWLAPHFEKTLYDNALLALCYTEAYQEGHLPLYKEIAERTLDYCLRELKSPEGAYYSSQDADSDGVEGKYYLFTPDEVKSVMGEETGR